MTRQSARDSGGEPASPNCRSCYESFSFFFFGFSMTPHPPTPRNCTRLNTAIKKTNKKKKTGDGNSSTRRNLSDIAQRFMTGVWPTAQAMTGRNHLQLSLNNLSKEPRVKRKTPVRKILMEMR